MKKKYYSAILISVFLISCYHIGFGWGIWGHEHINRAAVFALPETGGLRMFYYNHLDYLTMAAIEPDERKYALRDKEEFPRHYINLEWFEKPGDSIPRHYKYYLRKYPVDSLQKYGTLPWQIEAMTDSLSSAFRHRRTNMILFYSAVLGHYVGDAFMPLHTSIYHDGKTQKQKGVHSLWESQIPDLYGNTYNLKVDPAHFYPDITRQTWDIIGHSHSLAPVVLSKEDSLMSAYEQSHRTVYELDSAGKPRLNSFNSRYFSAGFVNDFNNAMHGMVSIQLNNAVSALSCYIYTAWKNAGSPDLSVLDASETTSLNKSSYRKEYKYWQHKRKVYLNSEPEFQGKK
jgi:hypothetical protein